MADDARRYLFTSEQVNCGHPDKLCDYISDSVLDAALEVDKDARVAIESAAKNNCVSIMGEITCAGELNFERIIREAVKFIGYDDIAKGLNHANMQVSINVDYQSQEIHEAVGVKGVEDIGAGDQGIMFGYATDEHPSFMPTSYVFATDLLKKYDELRRDGTFPWARPDAKSQVTLHYEQSPQGQKVLSVHTVLMSLQHSTDITTEEIAKQIKEKVVAAVIPKELLDDKVKYFINPSGSFIVGGPTGDAGLTGRKIIADTYGGWGSHGGGCFSGKDGSKVDRSGAYAARQIAKSLVANGFCHRCTVQVSYGIGIAEPLSIYVNSFNTAPSCGYTDNELDNIVQKCFDLKAGNLVKVLGLKQSIFRKTTLYGHFLKTDEQCAWEKVVDLSHAKKD